MDQNLMQHPRQTLLLQRHLGLLLWFLLLFSKRFTYRSFSRPFHSAAVHTLSCDALFVTNPSVWLPCLTFSYERFYWISF